MFWNLYRDYLGLMIIGAVVVFPIQVISSNLLSWTLAALPRATSERDRLMPRWLTLTGLGTLWACLTVMTATWGLIEATATWSHLHNVVAFWFMILLPPAGVICYLLMGLLIHRTTSRRVVVEQWADILGDRHRARLSEVFVADSVHRANLLWWFIAFIAPTFWGFGATITDNPASKITGASQAEPAVVCMLATGFALVIIGMKINDMALPHLKLLALGISVCRRSKRSGRRDRLALRPASWRTATHWLGFQTANSVERCLPGFRRRLAPDQLSAVYAAFGGLAVELRHRSIDAGSNEANRQYFDRLVRHAVGLVTAENPVTVAERLTVLLPDRSSELTGTRKMRTTLAAASTQLQGIAEGFDAIRKVIVGIVIVAAIAWLVVGGHLSALVSQLPSFK